MTTVRPMQRSGIPSAPHHQRQYSDNFLETSIGRWLQSNRLQHLNPSAQDFGNYGQGSRAEQRDFGYYDPPSTPSGNSRLVRKNSEGQVSTGELSPGLLDLHSFDTELLSEAFFSANAAAQASRR